MVVPFCEKHNKYKIQSKYPNKKTGEIDYWCPECYDEWKKKGVSKVEIKPLYDKPLNGNAMIIDEIQELFKKLNERLDSMGLFFTKLEKELLEAKKDGKKIISKTDNP